MFGVDPPIMPLWYALMFHIPTSSPQMMRILGYLFSARPAVGAQKNARKREQHHESNAQGPQESCPLLLDLPFKRYGLTIVTEIDFRA